MRVWSIILITLLSWPVWAAQDGNEGLYEMAAPADSAFVRVLNLSAEQAEVTLDDWRQSLAPGAVGAYLYRPAGDARLVINGEAFAYPVSARSVHTLVFDGQRVTPYRDTYFDNRLKALLVMYNLADQSATLQTANGAVNVIGPLARRSSDEREINGVRVGLQVRLDDGTALPLEEAVLQRGRVYTVVVLPGQARLEESRVATAP
ncbi:MAG: alginate O-acetyltransferase AlgF [Pseudomonadales bacterium]|nr:alginate O-acetyltransferase AlgF [Pseudomonadales bacterium]